MKLTVPLDKTDAGIISAIQKDPSKISTSELSELLGIPDRTVRYRLNKLRERKLLKPPKMMTYERKIGLGEQLLLLQSIPEKEDTLVKILDGIDFFYYYAPTYGRYDGYMVYTMFPLVAPRMVRQVAEELKEKGLVSDFYIFDLVDYCRKSVDLAPFLPESDWSWLKWSEEAKQIMTEGCDLELRLEEFPSTVKFDYRDIQIVIHMVENPGATQKEIGKVLELSSTQVHKRVKRLEDTGVIRGLKMYFSPFQDVMMIGCFFQSREHAKKILCGFHRLPFEITFVKESSTNYEVQVVLPSSEMNQFLQHMSIFRKYTEEFFIQTSLKGKSKGYAHLLKSFNRTASSWEMPLSDTMQTIRNISVS
ncbi:MAG: winged helix-turn-helix transcriptional regulator [Candidatus Thorarchaeota archaeon]|jgi:DNA-binding Lrp family transcriptional regulator